MEGQKININIWSLTKITGKQISSYMRWRDKNINIYHHTCDGGTETEYFLFAPVFKKIVSSLNNAHGNNAVRKLASF